MMVAHRTRILVRSVRHERNKERLTREEYHMVDLDMGIIHRNIAPQLLYPAGMGYNSMVKLGSGGSVYMFGGCETPDELTLIPENPTDNTYYYNGAAHLQIVNHDNGKVTGEWRDYPKQVFGDYLPSCTYLNEKIYNFGFVYLSPQVYDPISNCWEDIHLPSQFEGCRVSVPVLPDASANRIILHLREGPLSSHSLCAFYPNHGEWEVIDSDFDLWYPAIALVDGVIYFNYRKCHNLLCAYDMKNLRWLDVQCSAETAIDGWHIFELARCTFDALFFLGDNTFVLATTFFALTKSKLASDNNTDDLDVDDGFLKCRSLFLKFRIERNYSIIKLIPLSVQSFILPRTSQGRGMLLLT